MRKTIYLAVLIILILIPIDVAQADRPYVLEIPYSFTDINPCTGDSHDITINFTVRIHDHDGRLVAHEERALETSSGYYGRGTGSVVMNFKVYKATHNDMLVNEGGERIRVHYTEAIDLKTMPPTIKVYDDSVTCLGR